MEKNLKPIAGYAICNVASLNIYDIDCYGDYVIAGINNDKPRKYKTYYNSKGDVYFNYGGTRFYLNDFMRLI